MAATTAFYVWRRRAPGKTVDSPAQKLPRRRHATLAAAVTEAERLNRLQPQDVFQVVQVLAEVGPGLPIADSEVPY